MKKESVSDVESVWQQRFMAFQRDLDNPRRAVFARVGNATRRVIDRLVSTKASNEEMETIAQAVEAVADAIEHYPHGRTYEGFGEAANSGSPGGFFDHSPVSGVANPLAPPIRFQVSKSEEESKVTGAVRFGSAYEGPPGCVHGGFLAAAFDELLGRAQSLSGSPAMTAKLTVNYRKPTPLNTDLDFEGSLVKVDGRKVYTRGVCRHEGTVTAEAEALFISIDFARLAEIAKSQNRD